MVTIVRGKIILIRYWSFDTDEKDKSPVQRTEVGLFRYKRIYPPFAEGSLINGQFNILGLRYGRKASSWANGRFIDPNTELIVPLWMPTLVFAIIPACWLYGVIRRWGRVKGGHCRCCGYDLRMSPQRCPECGRAAVEPA